MTTTSILSPKVSIIIPCYNAEEYLRQCLDSVIKQTLKEIEIICVNDGSTDNTLDILSQYAKNDSRIIVINQENKRQSIARRNAMKIAHGEYIQYIDSDDWIREDACELLYTYAKENSSDIVRMGAINYNQEKNIFEDKGWYSFRWLPKNFKNVFSYEDCKEYLANIPLNTVLTFYQHDFLKRNNIQWLSEKIFYEDMPFTTEALLKAKRIAVLQECLYFRRWHEKSTVNNLNSNFGEWVTMVNKLLSIVENIDSTLIPYYIPFYLSEAKKHYQKISPAFKRKNFEPLLTFYERCVKYYHGELSKNEKKILCRSMLLSPIRVLRLLLTSCFYFKISLPIFSLKKIEDLKEYRFTCKILGIPLLKIRKNLKKQNAKYWLLGLPILKIRYKNVYKRFYLFFFIWVGRKNLFKKAIVPENERLILFFDALENDKNALSIDTWIFFEWLQKNNIPSRYVVSKHNVLVSNLIQQKHSFKDIILLDHDKDFLKICHDDICKSRLILTSFGCGSFDKTLVKIPYLKHVFIDHGVPLLKENITGLSLYNENRFDNKLTPTQLTAKLYQQKQVWQNKQIFVGLPRWEKLKRIPHSPKNIFVSFTWRKNIRLFVLKNYQKQILKFLTNPKLSMLLKKYKINLNIALHHALIRNGGNIIVPENINIISSKEIAEMKEKTDLFITDYSSLMFDFMFFDIPVISYRFDADCPYLDESDRNDVTSAKSHDSELYNIFYNEDDVIQKIEFYIKHNFELEDDYKKINASFWWEKENICEHLYEKIQSLYANISK